MPRQVWLRPARLPCDLAEPVGWAAMRPRVWRLRAPRYTRILCLSLLQLWGPAPRGEPRACAGVEYGQEQSKGLLAEEVELIYCAFDLLQCDGRSIAHEPLRVRHELLRKVISPCAEDGWALQEGRTAVTGRVVAILPGSVPLLPGCPASQFWSVRIKTAAEMLVRAARAVCGFACDVRTRADHRALISSQHVSTCRTLSSAWNRWTTRASC